MKSPSRDRKRTSRVMITTTRHPVSMIFPHFNTNIVSDARLRW